LEGIEQAEDFIRKNIRLFGFRTGFSFGRIDKMEYPMKAIREGVINALIHRNYYEPADTRVMIFDDRIEIVNSGSFPEGVTPEKPRHIPVNPALCQLMYDVGFIEKYAFREGLITNRIYREINKVSDETSRKELADIVEKGLLNITGKGRGVKYVPTLGD